jgi:SpoVK/Ycf46/Vps4 family AAA+-type ATPase
MGLSLLSGIGACAACTKAYSADLLQDAAQLKEEEEEKREGEEAQSALQRLCSSLKTAGLMMPWACRRTKKTGSVQQPPVTFRDVAGVDSALAELREVVACLKNASAYTRLGARMPAGVLLSGPPGTGKTLLGTALCRLLVLVQRPSCTFEG